LFEHNREFVAAQASGRISLAQTAPEPVRNLSKDIVADGVSERIVDGFEFIQIDEQNSNRCSFALRARHSVPQPIFKQGSIGQPSKQIMKGPIAKLSLVLAVRGVSPAALDSRANDAGHSPQEAELLGRKHPITPGDDVENAVGRVLAVSYGDANAEPWITRVHQAFENCAILHIQCARHTRHGRAHNCCLIERLECYKGQLCNRVSLQLDSPKFITGRSGSSGPRSGRRGADGRRRWHLSVVARDCRTRW